MAFAVPYRPFGTFWPFTALFGLLGTLGLLRHFLAFLVLLQNLISSRIQLIYTILCNLLWPLLAYLAFFANSNQVDLHINLHNQLQSLMAFLGLFNKCLSDLSSD
jgi:hypothetical protein